MRGTRGGNWQKVWWSGEVEWGVEERWNKKVEEDRVLELGRERSGSGEGGVGSGGSGVGRGRSGE